MPPNLRNFPPPDQPTLAKDTWAEVRKDRQWVYNQWVVNRVPDTKEWQIFHKGVYRCKCPSLATAKSVIEAGNIT